jgi:hypothetical protein
LEIVDLDGLTLGTTTGTIVQIDINAAGHGWFVDPTPSDDAEFGMWLDGDTRVADDTSPASGSMDLFTVVMHELGHVLGFEDLDAAVDPDDLMSPTLDAGVRHLLPETETDDVSQRAADQGAQRWEKHRQTPSPPRCWSFPCAG